METNGNELLRKYLLGDLTPTQRKDVETRYFASQEVWQTLRLVENDLIDFYVLGRLSAGERKQFETYYMASPTRRKRVELAQALLDPTLRERIAERSAEEDVAEPVTPSWPRLLAVAAGSDSRGGPGCLRHFWNHFSIREAAFAGAGLALACIALILTVQNQRLKGGLSRMQSENTGLEQQLSKSREQISYPVPAVKSAEAGAQLPTSTIPVISVLLTPGQLRTNAGNGHVVRAPLDPGSLVLLLDLARDEYSGYDAVLKTVDGKAIRHMEGLNSQTLANGGKVVALKLPSQLLTPGDYVVTLSGRRAGGGKEAMRPYAFSLRR